MLFKSNNYLEAVGINSILGILVLVNRSITFRSSINRIDSCFWSTHRTMWMTKWHQHYHIGAIRTQRNGREAPAPEHPPWKSRHTRGGTAAPTTRTVCQGPPGRRHPGATVGGRGTQHAAVVRAFIWCQMLYHAHL